MKRLDLLGLGECMVELYADQPLGMAKTLTKAYAGDVLNALVTASRLGAKVGFITRVGNDPFGEGMLEFWRSEGVDLAQALPGEGENGVYFISLKAGGEREFTYRRSGSAASRIRPEDLDAAYIGTARMLLLSGITQAISASAQAATLEAARLARGRGVKVAFDPNYRPRLWADRGGLQVARSALGQLVPLVDIFLPSFPSDFVLLAAEAEDAETTLRAIPQHLPLTAVKAAHQGAYLVQAGHSRHFPAASVEVVDSSGAGDAWNGAFLSELLRDRSPETAARTANRIAGRKLGFRGAIPAEPLL